MDTVTKHENVSHQIWMMIMRIYNENIRSFTSSLKEVGLNPTHFEILHLLRTQGCMDQKSIASTLNLTQGNITHCIRHLEVLDLVAVSKEWKTKSIDLNANGQALMCQLIPKQQELMEHSLRGLTCTQKDQLKELLVSFEKTCKKCNQIKEES